MASTLTPNELIHQAYQQKDYQKVLDLVGGKPAGVDQAVTAFRAAYILQDRDAGQDYAQALLDRTQLPTEVAQAIWVFALKHKLPKLACAAGVRRLSTQMQDPMFLHEFGRVAHESGEYGLATLALSYGLQLGGDLTAFHTQLACVFKDGGDQRQALRHFQLAYREKPTAALASHLAMMSLYTQGISLDAYYAQARDAEQVAYTWPAVRPDLAQLREDKAQTGLRIGFVSGDFVAHSLTALLLPIFAQFQTVGPHTLVIYQNRGPEHADSATRTYAQYTKEWYFTNGWSDDYFAEQIRADGIDVLIDLAGHTAEHRLQVFSRRPAPVQMGWISGMMTPTGYSFIPHFLTDVHMVPPVAVPETLYPLPTAFCYNPLQDQKLQTGLPADAVGRITFGSFNNPCKFSDSVLQVWARVLQAVPNSMMHIKVMSELTAVSVRKRLGELGVNDRRLVFVLPLPNGLDVMNYYTKTIDIVLDTFPCTGCLTAVEAWWMGVPTVTLVGPSFTHRQAYSLNAQLGLQELCAHSPDEYVELARRLAGDLPSLRRWRRSCRDMLDQTAIRRPREVAAAVYRAIEGAWASHCRSRQQLCALRATQEA